MFRSPNRESNMNSDKTVQIRSFIFRCQFSESEMSEKKNRRDEVRSEAKEAFEAMRKDIQQSSRQLVNASKTLKTSPYNLMTTTDHTLLAGLNEPTKPFHQ